MANGQSDPAAGIGSRSAHIDEMLSTRPPSLGLLEVHAENYMSGSPAIAALDNLRRDYALSLHGVGLSLGGAGEPDPDHLARLKALSERLEPHLISEHLAWSVHVGAYFNDLLPLPYTEESLRTVCRNVDGAQNVLGRRLLIENPAIYLRFRHATIDEPIFLAELAARTDCSILCDINNLYVNWQILDSIRSPTWMPCRVRRSGNSISPVITRATPTAIRSLSTIMAPQSWNRSGRYMSTPFANSGGARRSSSATPICRRWAN